MTENKSHQKLQPKALRAEDFEDDVDVKDDYFPDDGYDYEQHFVDLDTDSPLYMKATHDDETEYDPVYGKKPEFWSREEADLMAAMAEDDLEEMQEDEIIPLQFAAQREIDTYELRWGKYTDEERYGAIDMGHGGLGEFDMGEFMDGEDGEMHDDVSENDRSNGSVPVARPAAKKVVGSQMGQSQAGSRYQRTFIGSKAATRVGRDFDKFTAITSKTVNELRPDDRSILESQFEEVRKQYKDSEVGELTMDGAKGHIPVDAMRHIFEEAFETLVLANLHSKKKNRKFDKQMAAFQRQAERQERGEESEDDEADRIDRLMAKASWNTAPKQGDKQNSDEEYHVDEDQAEDDDEFDDEDDDDKNQNDWEDEIDSAWDEDYDENDDESSSESDNEGMDEIEIKLKKVAKDTFIERHLRVYQAKLKVDPLADMPEELERAIMRQERREIARSMKKEAENGDDIFYRKKRAEYRQQAKEMWRMDIDDNIRNQIITYMRAHINDVVDENVPFIESLINNKNKEPEDDCETVLSTLSSAYNRPSKIGLPKGSKPRAIKLVGPHQAPIGVLPSSLAKAVGLKKHQADTTCARTTASKAKGPNRLAAILEGSDSEDESSFDADETDDSSEGREEVKRISKQDRIAKIDKRIKGESNDDKKARKQAAKEAKQAAREYKKDKKEIAKAAINKKQIMNNPYDVRNGVKAVRI